MEAQAHRPQHPALKAMAPRNVPKALPFSLAQVGRRLKANDERPQIGVVGQEGDGKESVDGLGI